MPYITRLLVENCRNVTRLDLDLSPRTTDPNPFCHLILTGPNGSGKSGVLEAMRREIFATPGETVDVRDLYQSNLERLLSGGHHQEARQQKLILNDLRGQRPCQLFWDTRPSKADTGEEQWFTLSLPAGRQLELRHVDGPKKLDPQGTANLKASFLLQHLVNLKTEQAFAGVDRDEATVARIEGWFEEFRRQVSFVVDDPQLKIDFDRSAFNFVFIRGDGYRFDLRQLSDGASSVLAILAELLMRTDEGRRLKKDPAFEPAGVVLIDELEAHLHLRLQEAILPFLTGLFPKIQFIVATHSPAVIASIPGAIVHDLGSHETTRSEELQGKTYGTLMTGHFGTTSDVDLDTTAKLARYRELSRLAPAERPAALEQERRRLRGELTERSAELAVEVWMIDGSPPPEERHDQP